MMHQLITVEKFSCLLSVVYGCIFLPAFLSKNIFLFFFASTYPGLRYQEQRETFTFL